MAKTLTAKVSFDTRKAMTSLSALEGRIKRINQAVSKVGKVNDLNKKFTKVSNTVTKLTSKVNNAKSATDKLATSANNVNKNFQKSGNSVSQLAGKLKAVAAAYLGVMGARSMLNTSDTITSAENKLNNLNSGNTNLTQDQLDKMYSAANRSRMGYADMMSNVSKSMTLAGDAFGGNMDNAIKFQEIMGKSYALGGASAAEMHSSMYQLIQALGSGILQGDELRSVREGAPLAYKEIEKFAQGLFKTEESLKELASQGKITSDIVVAAMMNVGESMDKAFEKTSMIFAQAGVRLKNSATKAFEPVLQKLNDMLNSEVGQAILESIEKVFVFTAKVMYGILRVVEEVINWCAENWYWLKDVMEVVAIAGAGFLLYLLGPLGWIVGAILLIGYILVKCGLTVQEVVGGIAGVIMFIVYLSITVTVWVVNIVYWAIALIWDALVSIAVVITNLIIAIGTIIGLVLQGIIQLVLWVITTIISIIVTLYNIIYTIVKGAWGVIKGAIVGIYQSFVWLGQGVLYVLYGIAEAIDFIFGSNLSDTVMGWIDGLGSSVDKLNEKLDPLGEFEDIGSQWKSSYSDLGDRYAGRGEYDDWNITDNMVNLATGAWDLMGEVGKTGVDMMLDPTLLNDWTLEHTLNPMDGWNKGYNFGSNLVTEMENLFKDLNLENGLDGFDASDLLKDLDSIDNNTGRVADDMELAKEDLDYLRKIADMEWKKEYTTASIKVDMTNNNSINGESDLDGLVTKLTDKLYEELNVVANGVYA